MWDYSHFHSLRANTCLFTPADVHKINSLHHLNSFTTTTSSIILTTSFIAPTISQSSCTLPTTMVPTPYNVRWTAKLIRRDLKGIATRCTSKVRGLFKRTPVDTSDLSSFVNQADEDPITDSESVFYSARFTQSDTDAVTDGESVFYDAFETIDRPSLVGPDAEGNDSIIPTQGRDDISEVFVNQYEVLTATHKDLFASRERDLPCKERWRFRGSWLLLHQAIQFCASNPIFEIWKDSPSEVEVAAALEPIPRKFAQTLKRSQLIYSEDHTLSSPTTSRPSRISRMPAMVYAQRGNVHNRHDSIFSTISARPASPISQAELWYIVEAGVLDRAKTALAAECLLSHVWNEKDALAMLDVMGDPAKHLSEEEETELRKRLGHALFLGHFVDSR
jgi:hypothetical protein